MHTRHQILLVDDDRAWLETLSEYLRDKGFDVATAGDGESGLALVEEYAPALAIVDVNMPGLDGFDLLRQTRRRRSTVVLLVTGDEDPTLPARARAEGAYALLPKTASPALLLRIVRQAIAAASPGIMGLLFPRRSDHLLPTPGKGARQLPFRPLRKQQN